MAEGIQAYLNPFPPRGSPLTSKITKGRTGRGKVKEEDGQIGPVNL